MDIMARRQALITNAMNDRTIIGTFEYSSNDEGTIKTIELPYHGDGYPISIIIFPSTGPGDWNAGWASRIQRYANVFYCATKLIFSPSLLPDYSDPNNDGNYGFVVSRYKNSATSAGQYTTASLGGDLFYSDSEISENAHYSIVGFENKNTMKIYVANTKYGFMSGVEYTYIIEYSR